MNKDRTKDGHHIIGKRNDYLIAKINHSTHLANPYADFDDQLIDALENLFDYVEWWEEWSPSRGSHDVDKYYVD